MARTVKNAKLDSRSSRLKLAVRREPYWAPLSPGCATGYRRVGSGKAGSWIARLTAEDGSKHYQSLGGADDVLDADGWNALDFSQAQAAARTFFAAKARVLAGDHEEPDGPYTVADALKDYFAERERRGSKGLRADQYAAKARIEPDLGRIELARLTTKRIREWLHKVEKAPKLLRTKSDADTRRTVGIDAEDPDAVRSRRATANRIMTVLKAALNHAFNEGKVVSDEAWRKVKPYREADAPVIRYLSAEECVRLVNASAGNFRHLVRGALVTGCRYGELIALHARDFNADAGTIAIRTSKAGKARHVALNDEGVALFMALTAGQGARTLIFRRDDSEPWGASHQQRPLEAASVAAKIDPPATFHILRHTYASALAMKGVPMGVIAAQLGHADTRMTERHYAHLAPSYVASTVRAALPALGIVEMNNVRPMRSA